MKTRESGQNDGKMVAKMRVFGLAQEHTGSCGSFNDGFVCHISLEAYKLIYKNVCGGSCMAEFCNPPYSKMAAK